MTTVASPCLTCRHRRGPNDCAAYPRGIPPGIMFMEPHLRKVRGQVGSFVYEPVEGGPPASEFSPPPEA